MHTAPVAVIDEEHAAFMQGGVSISVASCDRDKMPCLVRALGCRLSPDRRQLRILVATSQASRVLACIRETGAVAAVFSHPATLRTVQVKGMDATESATSPADVEAARRYCEAFIRETVPLGFDEAMMQALLSSSELTAIAFTPSAAFLQTPGPKAGEPLKAPA